MATTTNYSWSTPDDTALVKDGASAIRTLGSSVDTTVKNLNPETTLGDLAYRSSTANVKTRLALGTAGQVLKVNSGATAPEWGSVAAGNLVETVFTSSNATYTIPSGVTQIWALCVGSGGGGGASSTATAANGGGGGGAGQVIEKVFTVVGDTQLNITVPAGGAGGTAGGKGSSGSAATIVGVTSATTYLSAAGGGGGGGGALANVDPIAGASSGGIGRSAAGGGGGGGMGHGATNVAYGLLNTVAANVGGGGIDATTIGVTGFNGGEQQAHFGGAGVNVWGRSLAGGGQGGGGTTTGIANNFGAGAATAIPSAGSNATANTGAGGNAGKTNATTALAGGNGGSGLVVLRYIG